MQFKEYIQFELSFYVNVFNFVKSDKSVYNDLLR